MLSNLLPPRFWKCREASNNSVQNCDFAGVLKIFLCIDDDDIVEQLWLLFFLDENGFSKFFEKLTQKRAFKRGSKVKTE